jgi:hypothetical protein
MTRLLLTLGLAGALAAALAAPALAQRPPSDAEVHRLEIRDGALFHDGAPLPATALPAGVDLTGVPAMYMDYSGDVTPAIEIDGRVFAFTGGRLVEVEAAAEPGRAQAFALSQPRPVSFAEADDRRRDAEAAYLETLSESDRALYERLMREREMEAETLHLAQRYRLAPTDAERATVRAELRSRLSAMFDLKQENRREEIRQMEVVLDTLRERLRERAAMRERIVEYRLNELVGQ